MKVKEGIKSVLPLPFFYSLRDLYASFFDMFRFFSVRRDFLNNPMWKDAFISLNVFFYPQKRILFHPERPSLYHSVFKLCAVLGYKITTNPYGKYDVAFWNDPSTFSRISNQNPDKQIRKVGINGRCTDVSKKKIGQVFEEVFGYSLDVDPLRYDGSIVEKSNLNAVHDGKVLQAPISADSIREGAVYQKEIDNRIDEQSLSLVYRVPVYGGEIPVVFLKYRSPEDRFTGNYKEVGVELPDEIFSENEIRWILQLTEVMNLDYGELDVLRDSDENVYVIDVNNTPGGPPRKMTHRQKIESTKKLIPSFKRLLDAFTLSQQK